MFAENRAIVKQRNNSDIKNILCFVIVMITAIRAKLEILLHESNRFEDVEGQ